MVFHDRGQGRFVQSPLKGSETLRLIPSNRKVFDWERVEGGKTTVSGEFMWVESEEIEGRGVERCLEVTAVIFVAPDAWARIIVPLVLGQGGGLDRLLREAREVRGEWGSPKPQEAFRWNPSGRNLMDAEARMEEAREFPRDRQGYRPLRREEEECQDRRDLREGRSAEAGGRPRRWVERIPGAVTSKRQALVGQRTGAEMRMPAREGAIEGSRGLPIESRWADLPDARMGEAQEFPRDRVGYRPTRREEEGGPSRRDLRDERPAEACSRPRRWAVREADAAWAPGEITGRSQGVEAWRSFRGQDHARWETDWPNERGRYGEDPWGPPRPQARVKEPDPSWYKPYDPAIDGPMEEPYFRRYDDRRVPYYDVNLGLEALFFDGRDVTGFVEKWKSYAYRKRFSEREWIDYFIQHSDPELDPAIRAIYPADG
ncbi:hypothetical protein CBR_g72645 [Chara braunii]|uniref:Uncharacterized protein n=1 Tax=Chara braunii TaxID=69332 RepID=A0A388KA18_CHABU|nr:hypothetical protein CBR_g72645 [Chara braunii]|eukprot:GBG66890.1 hypothetical protein CBR_g72645 [Chara braunii]